MLRDEERLPDHCQQICRGLQLHVAAARRPVSELARPYLTVGPGMVRAPLADAQAKVALVDRPGGPIGAERKLEIFIKIFAYNVY